MIKVKECYSTALEIEINNFLSINPNIELIDIKYGITTVDDDISTSALIIYKED